MSLWLQSLRLLTTVRIYCLVRMLMLLPLFYVIFAKLNFFFNILMLYKYKYLKFHDQYEHLMLLRVLPRNSRFLGYVAGAMVVDESPESIKDLNQKRSLHNTHKL